MPTTTAVVAASFPQTDGNRKVSQIIEEIAGYIGGKDRGDIKNSAREELFGSIREFNGFLWEFNRLSDDLTLANPVSGTDAEYNLSANFYRPVLAQMVDSASPNPQTRDLVSWIDWKEWAKRFPWQNTTGSVPIFYTARNIHELGRVIIDPPPASTLTYPTMRVFYFRRIFLPADTAVINVPQEFEESLVLSAAARLVLKRKGRARELTDNARIHKQRMIDEYRDFQDF